MSKSETGGVPPEFKQQTVDEFAGITFERIMYEIQWTTKTIQERVDPEFPTDLRKNLERKSMTELMNMLVSRRYVLFHEGQLKQGENSMATKKSAAKVEEPKAAKKPAKKAATPTVEKDEETSGRGRAKKYTPEMKIKLLVKENPKREGSAAHGRYEIYRDVKTVGEFLEQGGTGADLTYDSRAGNIEIS